MKRSLTPHEQLLMAQLDSSERSDHRFWLVRMADLRARIIMRDSEEDNLRLFGERYVIFPGESIFIIECCLSVVWERSIPSSVKKATPLARPYQYADLCE